MIKYTCIVLLTLYTYFPLHSHGLGTHTRIHQPGSYTSIESLFHGTGQKNKWISSYNQQTKTPTPARICLAGKSITPRYIKISFDTNQKNDILCTSTQQFYLAKLGLWIHAYQLQPNDILKSKHGTKAITSIEIVNESLQVYALEVAKTHTFFAGNHAILTHNVCFPAIAIGLGTSFGTGAAAGGATGCFLGPITCAGGIIIGGLIGATVNMCIQKKRIEYNVDCVFDRYNGHQNTIEFNDNEQEGLTNKKAREQALKWGYKETKEGKFNSKGRPKFIKGNSIITPDIDNHGGGVWKEFNRKNKRIGTLDKDGNKIKQ